MREYIKKKLNESLRYWHVDDASEEQDEYQLGENDEIEEPNGVPNQKES
jgi:hypothetical protein